MVGATTEPNKGALVEAMERKKKKRKKGKGRAIEQCPPKAEKEIERKEAEEDMEMKEEADDQVALPPTQKPKKLVTVPPSDRLHRWML